MVGQFIGIVLDGCESAVAGPKKRSRIDCPESGIASRPKRGALKSWSLPCGAFYGGG